MSQSTHVPVLKLSLKYSVLTFLSTQSRLMHIKSIPAVSRGKPVNTVHIPSHCLKLSVERYYTYMHVFVNNVFTNLGAWNVCIANTSQSKIFKYVTKSRQEQQTINSRTLFHNEKNGTCGVLRDTSVDAVWHIFHLFLTTPLSI